MTTHFRVGACLQFAKQQFLCDTCVEMLALNSLLKVLLQPQSTRCVETQV